MRFDDAKLTNAKKLHDYLFRPPRPPFNYAPWMDELVRVDRRRRNGKEDVDHASFREAYEAGLNGDLDSVDAFLGMYELAKED